MRFIVADWGTTRFRGYLVENETILDRVASDEGVSQLQAGQHQRCKTRLLEVRVLGDENVDIVRDADIDRVDNFVEDLAGVGFVELGCEVGVDEALAVG